MVLARDTSPVIARQRRRLARLLTPLAAVARAGKSVIDNFLSRLADMAPKGLMWRAALIIILPIALLEIVVTYGFLEEHWQSFNRRLSEATAREVAALIDVYRAEPPNSDYQNLIAIARDRLNLSLQVLPAGELPGALPRPFFDIFDKPLSNELRKQVYEPFWVDTVGDSSHVEIRVKLPKAVLRIIAKRSQTFASNSIIVLMWMLVASIVLMGIAIQFLGNQIKPILRLAEAADAFGKGRPVAEDFRPRGAREVRQAAQAFLEMRQRILQHVEQRTTMLAGVSHDLRTVLTRFKLEVALLGESSETRALKADVNEMQHMLEDYLAFAKGDGGEVAKPTNLRELLTEIQEEAQVFGKPVDLRLRRRRRELVLPLKRQAFKRAITNLVSNAVRFGDHVVIRAATQKQVLRIEVDDDGPGVPPAERDNVFRPFYRLDHARNQDGGNSGLGLAIARDIARSQGGDIALGTSSLGGLRAVISIPL